MTPLIAPIPSSVPDAGLVAEARRRLAERDPALARVDRLTPPPTTWRTQPSGYPALIWTIIGQQVSTVSAEACWARLTARVGTVTPESVLALSDDDLRTVGFSRQKTRYARAIAKAGLDYDALHRLSEEDALAALTALTGVGRWTAECYLLMSEGRLDAFPGGDIALQEAIRWADGLDARPDPKAAYARAEAWRPYRGVAANLLWDWYVGVKAGALSRG